MVVLFRYLAIQCLRPGNVTMYGEECSLSLNHFIAVCTGRLGTFKWGDPGSRCFVILGLHPLQARCACVATVACVLPGLSCTIVWQTTILYIELIDRSTCGAERHKV